MPADKPGDEIDRYFAFGAGHLKKTRWRQSWKALRLLDRLSDARIAPAVHRARADAANARPASVLIAAVEVPGREAELAHVIARITDQTCHQVHVSAVPMAPVGKFDNINRALAGQDLEAIEWLMIVDDDIEVPDGFLDLMIHFARRHRLTLAQPAHRFRSYASFTVTERHWGTLVRQTAFVEIGPVTLLHRDAFAALLPFPSLRWAWGLDFAWADLAQKQGWIVGVVDAAPIGHMRPVGGTYDQGAAQAEAIAFLRGRGVTIGRDRMLCHSQGMA